MWLLYGEDGQTLKTMIAHGAPAILVGNPLYLYFAFPESVGISSKSLYITATDSEGTTIGSSIDYQTKYYSAVFSKAYVGEMTGSFVEGQSYDIFEVKVSVSSSDDGIVMQPRTVNITPTIVDDSNNTLNLGGFSITVLANGKKAPVPMITVSQYQKLLAIIGNMGIAAPKGFKNGTYVTSSSEIYMVFFKGIGMVYGKIEIAIDPEMNVWTTIASYDTQGKYKLRAKSVAIANNSNDSDAEIRAIQNYSTVKDLNGDYVPTTIDIQIFNAIAGDSIEFSSPILVEYKDSTAEDENDQVFLKKTVAEATYLPFVGGTMTGDISMTSGKVIKFYNTKAFTLGDYSISFVTPTTDSVVAYQSWVSDNFATKTYVDSIVAGTIFPSGFKAWKQLATGQSTYNLASGKTFLIIMSNPSAYAYICGDSSVKSYGTFMVLSGTGRHLRIGGIGTGLVANETYDYNGSINGTHVSGEIETGNSGLANGYETISYTPITATNGTMTIYSLEDGTTS